MFDAADLPKELDHMSLPSVNALPFGAIGLNDDNIVEIYNSRESVCTGLSAENVVGRHLFHEVAPCLNNYMVAEVMNDNASLDVTIPYVLTFRMRPTPVKLRLLRSPGSARRWVLIERD